MEIATLDKPYTHVFFHDSGTRGVYTKSSGKTKYFEMDDPNFKNPAKLLAIMGMNTRVFVSITGAEMTVLDWYYIKGKRFFTVEEITKYCIGLGWKYETN